MDFKEDEKNNNNIHNGLSINSAATTLLYGNVATTPTAKPTHRRGGHGRGGGREELYGNERCCE